MDKQNHYYSQVQLLLQIIPYVAEHKCFALKGGTAINLFIRDFPRLSVDIDLVFLPIELSPVLRGTVYEPSVIPVCEGVEEEFGFAEMQVVHFSDLYAGKICAALDRQHPRDLFDVKWLLDNEGISDSLRKALLVYMISHNRPIAELLRPHLKDISDLYEGEFKSMTQEDVSLNELETTRTRLINLINSSLTKSERQFLMSFKRRAPDWSLLDIGGAEHLPAVRWKRHNLSKMSTANHAQAVQELAHILKT